MYIVIVCASPMNRTIYYSQLGQTSQITLAIFFREDSSQIIYVDFVKLFSLLRYLCYN